MQHQDLNADYSQYTFEDFLQDDFFVTSIKEGDMEFWENLKRENKIDRNAFCAAKDFLEALQEHNDNLADNVDLPSLWSRIQTSNRKNKTYKRFIYIGSCAAACIALLAAYPYITSIFQQNVPQDIALFAQENAATIDSRDIQVILSDEKTINIGESDTDIVYDSTQIKIAQTEVSKKESSPYNQLIVPKGKRSKLTLSDGSKLIVNAGTRVVYPIEFSQDKREIYVDGEIFIDVSRNEKKPFIVKTSDMSIHVLGTQFNIMAYESDRNKQVVLARGSVEIQKGNKADGVILKPSQMYEYNNGQSKVETVDVSYYTSWVDGVYIFENQELSDVALRLSRYYGANIACSEEIQHLRCSGKMDLKDNLEDIFAGLSFSFPIAVDHTDNKYVITKK